MSYDPQQFQSTIDNFNALIRDVESILTRLGDNSTTIEESNAQQLSSTPNLSPSRSLMTPETCDPVRPSEVITGAASSQYSTGEVTDVTTAEGLDLESGARENARTDDFDTDTTYPNGSNPMQSPDMGGTFAKRYGIGFLCAVYPNPADNLAEVQGYQSPTSTFQQAFQNVDKSKQFNNPSAAQIISGIQAWTTLLHNALSDCEQGKLLVSFQGHGVGGNMIASDNNSITPGQLSALARSAEAQRVSITYILDACESGGAVTEFQEHAADYADKDIDSAEGAGQVCSEENDQIAEELRDMMAHARELIQLSARIGRYGSDINGAANNVSQLPACAPNAPLPPPYPVAWARVRTLNQTLTNEIQAMQTQFLYNMDFGSDPEMRLDLIESAFQVVLAALSQVDTVSQNPPPNLSNGQAGFDLDNNWCAPVGTFQDDVSDGANRIIRLCDQRARDYAALPS